MWVHPYTWLQLLSEIQRRSYESRVSQTDPVSGLPQSNIKKSLLNCFNFIKSHFIRISNIPWDHGGIKLYLSGNIDSSIVQCTGYCNMRGNKSTPSFYISDQKTTDKNCFGYYFWVLQDKSYPFIQNTLPENVGLAWKVAFFFLQHYSTQELYTNCSDQQ